MTIHLLVRTSWWLKPIPPVQMLINGDRETLGNSCSESFILIMRYLKVISVWKFFMNQTYCFLSESWIILSNRAYSSISRAISVRFKVILSCWPTRQMFCNFNRHVICWISAWFMILMMPLICLMIVQSGVDVIIGLVTFNQVVFEYYWIRNSFQYYANHVNCLQSGSF